MKNCSFFLVAYITFVFLSTAAVLCWTTFDVTELNTCPPQDSKFLTLVERSLDQCIEECARRKSCAVVGYKRVLRLCELHMKSSAPNVSDNHCIMIMRDDIHGPKQDSCEEWQVFETTAGVEHCTVKECKPQPPLINGQFLGNKNEVGSKKAVKCKYGYIEENNTKSVECLKEGIWSHNVSCVLKDCGAVSPISNGTVTLDITGQTTYQSTASVNCSVGYETVNKTVTCLATGTWSASECVIKCPNTTGIIELKEDFRLKIYKDKKLDWHEANTSCASEPNGHLVVLDKKWKMDAVSNILTSCSGYKENRYWTDGECRFSRQCKSDGECQFYRQFYLQCDSDDPDEECQFYSQCDSDDSDGECQFYRKCDSDDSDGECQFSRQCTFTNGTSMPMKQPTFWHTGKPNNKNSQSCVRVRYKTGVYRWNDKPCNIQYPYICEY